MKKIIAIVLVVAFAMGFCSISSMAAPIVKYGDVDLNNVVSSNDALLVLQHSTGLKTLDNYCIALADVNSDSKVNSSDALAILQTSTGLIDILKNYDSTKKCKTIDSVLSQKSYTFGLTYKMPESEDLTVKDGAMEMIFTTDGTNKAICSKMEIDIKDALNEAGIPTYVSTYLPIEYRLLYLNGKNYELMPEMKVLTFTVSEATYRTTTEDVSASFDGYVELFTLDMVYSGTDSKGTERFVTLDGMVLDFYFNGNTPAKLIVSQSGSTQEFGITQIVKGAQSNLLTLDGFKPEAE